VGGKAQRPRGAPGQGAGARGRWAPAAPVAVRHSRPCTCVCGCCCRCRTAPRLAVDGATLPAVEPMLWPFPAGAACKLLSIAAAGYSVWCPPLPVCAAVSSAEQAATAPATAPAPTCSTASPLRRWHSEWMWCPSGTAARCWPAASSPPKRCRHAPLLPRCCLHPAPAGHQRGDDIPCTAPCAGIWLAAAWLGSEARGRRPVGCARCAAAAHHPAAPPTCVQALEGSISAALVTPDLRHAGTFRASFLVVAALPHPANNLGNLQRSRWVPGGSTLDIGWVLHAVRGLVAVVGGPSLGGRASGSSGAAEQSGCVLCVLPALGLALPSHALLPCLAAVPSCCRPLKLARSPACPYLLARPAATAVPAHQRCMGTRCGRTRCCRSTRRQSTMLSSSSLT
jgi:hypothetical protein